MFSDRERWWPHYGLDEAMPQVFLFRSELRQTCHPTTWRCYAAGDYFRDGGYRHGSATSQAVSRIWDMHGFQSDVHVDGSIGHITLDEGCYYSFQSHCITCIPRLESRAPKRFHPASLHTVEERMHDEVDPIADSEHTSIKKKNSWWLLVTKVRHAALVFVPR